MTFNQNETFQEKSDPDDQDGQKKLQIFCSENLEKTPSLLLSNLSFKELEVKLSSLTYQLGGLLKYCKDKTELAVFLDSVANEFLTEDDNLVEVESFFANY